MLVRVSEIDPYTQAGSLLRARTRRDFGVRLVVRGIEYWYSNKLPWSFEEMVEIIKKSTIFNEEPVWLEKLYDRWRRHWADNML